MIIFPCLYLISTLYKSSHCTLFIHQSKIKSFFSHLSFYTLTWYQRDYNPLVIINFSFPPKISLTNPHIITLTQHSNYHLRSIPYAAVKSPFQQKSVLSHNHRSIIVHLISTGLHTSVQQSQNQQSNLRSIINNINSNPKTNHAIIIVCLRRSIRHKNQPHPSPHEPPRAVRSS